MFRRSKPETATTPAATRSAPKAGGKGRPTPTRREAEAARRAKAKKPLTRREEARLKRQRRAQEGAKMREGLKSGDERYLPARDRGPVRRFVRDRVDARLSMAEFLLPALLLIMALQYSPNDTLRAFSNGLWSATILLVGLDTIYLVWRLKRDLRQRFAGETTKGAVFYGILRSLQLRFLRLPKPRVKVGQRLTERY